MGHFTYFVILVLVIFSQDVAFAAPEGRDEMDALSCMTRPLQVVTLNAPVAGRVEQVAVGEGALVQMGKPIVFLERTLESLEEKKQRLILNNHEGIKAARLNEELEKRLLERSESLYVATHSISQEELQKRRLEYALAQSEVRRLEQQKRVEEVVHAIAVEEVALRVIKAPFKGVVVKLHKHIGESADAHAPLVELVDASQGEVICNLRQQVVEQLAVGQKITVVLRVGGKRVEVSGSVHFISPVVDPASGLVSVKLLFDNGKHPVRLGISGYLELHKIQDNY
ncbi:MAG: efflux RND transporter periplasmic adaptor subunit [Magnetococcales bacterium]|nr:efflux RND transporter periplasmic adaptor subunit [Magnetococcales bacterium]